MSKCIIEDLSQDSISKVNEEIDWLKVELNYKIPSIDDLGRLRNTLSNNLAIERLEVVIPESSTNWNADSILDDIFSNKSFDIILYIETITNENIYIGLRKTKEKLNFLQELIQWLKENNSIRHLVIECESGCQELETILAAISGIKTNLKFFSLNSVKLTPNIHDYLVTILKTNKKLSCLGLQSCYWEDADLSGLEQAIKNSKINDLIFRRFYSKEMQKRFFHMLINIIKGSNQKKEIILSNGYDLAKKNIDAILRVAEKHDVHVRLLQNNVTNTTTSIQPSTTTNNVIQQLGTPTGSLREHETPEITPIANASKQAIDYGYEAEVLTKFKEESSTISELKDRCQKELEPLVSKGKISQEKLQDYQVAAQELDKSNRSIIETTEALKNLAQSSSEDLPQLSHNKQLTPKQVKILETFTKLLNDYLEDLFLKSLTIAKGLAKPKLGVAETIVNIAKFGGSLIPLPCASTIINALAAGTLKGLELNEEYKAGQFSRQVAGSIHLASQTIQILSRILVIRYQRPILELHPESLAVFAFGLVERIYEFINSAEGTALDKAQRILPKTLVAMLLGASAAIALDSLDGDIDNQLKIDSEFPEIKQEVSLKALTGPVVNKAESFLNNIQDRIIGKSLIGDNSNINLHAVALYMALGASLLVPSYSDRLAREIVARTQNLISKKLSPNKMPLLYGNASNWRKTNCDTICRKSDVYVPDFNHEDSEKQFLCYERVSAFEKVAPLIGFSEEIDLRQDQSRKDEDKFRRASPSSMKKSDWYPLYLGKKTILEELLEENRKLTVEIETLKNSQASPSSPRLF